MTVNCRRRLRDLVQPGRFFRRMRDLGRGGLALRGALF
jgi:hypothetical protein